MPTADQRDFSTQRLAAARSGDTPALGALLEPYRGYLSILADLVRRRTGRGDVDPEDLVQETFLRAHRFVARFRGSTEAEWRGWLRQILLSRLARNTRLPEAHLADSLEHSSRRLAVVLADSTSSPARKAIRHEDALRVADALMRLPRHYREVVVLRYFEDLTYAEIGGRLGKSADAVEMLWRRSYPLLCRFLGGGQ